MSLSKPIRDERTRNVNYRDGQFTVATVEGRFCPAQLAVQQPGFL